MRRVDVMGVRVESPTNRPVLLLRERDGDRYVPVWIGAPEAAAIVHADQGIVPPRPFTHELMIDLVRVLGDEFERVEVEVVNDGVFYATLVLKSGKRVDARTSDAVAVALLARVPILVADAIFDEIGLLVEPEEDDEVERFREFLDHVSADDFVDDGGTTDDETPE